MKENKKEIPLMSEEEFEDYLATNNSNFTKYLRTFNAVSKYKSLNRAIKRGHVSLDGVEYPDRPFSNKKNSCKRKGRHSRSTNELKKKIYGELRERQSED